MIQKFRINRNSLMIQKKKKIIKKKLIKKEIFDIIFFMNL